MKVGDYVRTEYGISKIYQVYKQFILITTYYKQIMNEDIIKSSPDIIDLIVPHDILELYDKDYGLKYKAEVILDDSGMKCISNYDYDDLLDLEYELITHEHINLISIVTKEQFESMKYKVGE